MSNFTSRLKPFCWVFARPEARSKIPPGTIVLTGAGATFPSILYNHWIVAYHIRNRKVIIEYSPVGSGEGVRRFIGKNITEKESVDFGASDTAMSDTELVMPIIMH